MTTTPSAAAADAPQDAAFYEREYSPRAAIPGAAELIAGWLTRSDAVRARLGGVHDLAYGPGERERLDLIPGEASERGASLLVFIHGGFWRSLSKEHALWMAAPYVERGFAVALLEYALVPQVDLDTIVAQTRAAIAWLHRHAQAHGAAFDGMVVAGHSAGGHLALMAACTDWPAVDATLPADPIKAVVSVSGIADLLAIQRMPSLNADVRVTDAQVAALSPGRLQPARGTRIVTAVGALESSEFKRQSALLRSCWPGHPIDEIDMPGLHHISACDAFADPSHGLFQATCAALQG